MGIYKNPILDYNKNFKKYQELIANDEWYNLHKEEYVAIVDGKLVKTGKDKSKLLREIREDYPHGIKFLKKIDREEGVVDFPSIVAEHRKPVKK